MTCITKKALSNRERQRRLRERRKEEGWKRVGVWLSPDEVKILDSYGEEWLGRTVKALLSYQAANDLSEINSKRRVLKSGMTGNEIAAALLGQA